jgi:hypothetical protein
LSSFGRDIRTADSYEFERDLLEEYLDELDALFGAPPGGLVEEIDDRWPSSS